MAQCPTELVELPCGLSGEAMTSQPFRKQDDVIELASGNGAVFPDVPDGEYFYAVITDPCGDCCEEVKVVGKDGDTLEVERYGEACDCIDSTAQVRYAACSKRTMVAAAKDVPFNVVSPLEWDCETRTLSLNCSALLEDIAELIRNGGGSGDGSGGSSAVQVAINNLNDRVDNVESQLNDFPTAGDLDDLADKVDQCDCEDMTHRIEVLENNTQNIPDIDEFDDIKSDVATVKTTQQSVTGRLDTNEGKISTITDQVQDNIDRLDTQEQRLDDHDDTLQDHDQRLNQLRVDVDKNTDDINGTSSETGILDRLDDHEDRITDLEP